MSTEPSMACERHAAQGALMVPDCYACRLVARAAVAEQDADAEAKAAEAVHRRTCQAFDMPCSGPDAADVATARAVLDAVGHDALSDKFDSLHTTAADAIRELDVLRAERNRLHRVVATYGEHTGDCPAYDEDDMSPECECGWNHACVRSFEFAGRESLDQDDAAEG